MNERRRFNAEFDGAVKESAMLRSLFSPLNADYKSCLEESIQTGFLELDNMDDDLWDRSVIPMTRIATGAELYHPKLEPDARANFSAMLLLIGYQLGKNKISPQMVRVVADRAIQIGIINPKSYGRRYVNNSVVGMIDAFMRSGANLSSGNGLNDQEGDVSAFDDFVNNSLFQD
jgi:hypothetical protein